MSMTCFGGCVRHLDVPIDAASGVTSRFGLPLKAIWWANVLTVPNSITDSVLILLCDA